MRSDSRSSLVAVLAALFIGSLALAACSSDEEKIWISPIEQPGDEVVSRMCEKIAEAPSLSIRARRRIDPTLMKEPGLPERAEISLMLLRPVTIYAVIDGGGSERRVYYDGKEYVFHDVAKKAYEQGPVMGGIDGLIDLINDRLGIRSPIAEFLRTYPYVGLTKRVKSGSYVGIETRDGKRCHRVAIIEDRATWDLWVEVGTDLPVRLEARSIVRPGSPGVEVEFLDFDLAPDLDRSRFEFKPSADLTRVK